MSAQSLRFGSANRNVERCAFALEAALQNRARWAPDLFAGLVGLSTAPWVNRTRPLAQGASTHPSSDQFYDTGRVAIMLGNCQLLIPPQVGATPLHTRPPS
jgi:hypothetical protein